MYTSRSDKCCKRRKSFTPKRTIAVRPLHISTKHIRKHHQIVSPNHTRKRFALWTAASSRSVQMVTQESWEAITHRTRVWTRCRVVILYQVRVIRVRTRTGQPFQSSAAKVQTAQPRRINFKDHRVEVHAASKCLWVYPCTWQCMGMTSRCQYQHMVMTPRMVTYFTTQSLTWLITQVLKFNKSWWVEEVIVKTMLRQKTQGKVTTLEAQLLTAMMKITILSTL